MKKFFKITKLKLIIFLVIVFINAIVFFTPQISYYNITIPKIIHQSVKIINMPLSFFTKPLGEFILYSNPSQWKFAFSPIYIFIILNLLYSYILASVIAYFISLSKKSNK